MNNRELKAKLDDMSNRLVPVAGELMRRACQDNFIHEETCTCNTCRCFVTVQSLITEMEQIMKEIPD